MPALQGITTAARILTCSDRLDDVLPPLHQRAVEAVGGVNSVLLQFNLRTGRFLPTSGHALAGLDAEKWAPSPEESVALESTSVETAPVLIGDLATRMPDLARLLATPAALLVPLSFRQRERLGILAIGLRAPVLEPQQAARAGETGDWFALALERARLLRSAEFQREVKELLQAFSHTASSVLNLGPALEVFCHDVNHLFRADRASIWLYDRREKAFTLTASSGGPAVAEGTGALTEPTAAAAVAAMRRERSEVLAPRREGCGVTPAWPTLTVPLRARRRFLGLLVFDGVRIDPSAEPDLLDRADELGRRLSAHIENTNLIAEVLLSRRELEQTVNSIPDLVAICDLRLQVVHVNQALAERLRRRRDELVGRPITQLVGPATGAWIAGLELSGSAHAFTREFDDPVLGGRFSVTATARLNEDGESIGSVVVARDISWRARLEAERAALRAKVAQSEKLAALGQFVAGIAHELNNPLQGALGHLELIQHQQREYPREMRRELRLVYREADRAAKIVRNLLVFAGGRRLARRVVNLNTALTRALAIRASALRAARVEVVRRLDEALPRVQGDPLLLQQALLNIIINAEQAMAGLETGRIEVSTAYAPERGRVAIRVRDTGPGIPSEVLPRIFEPFYTTKEVGKGVGLGLAIAYGIIQEHAGQISAENCPDGGAIFTVELPAHQQVPRVSRQGQPA